VKTNVNRFLEGHRLKRRLEKEDARYPYVILNVSAREWNKRISPDQAAFLANLLVQNPEITTVVTSAPEDARMKNAIVSGTKSTQCIGFPDAGTATMHEVSSLVEGAVCVITPDTSIIHVASSTSTPVLGLFTPLQVNQEWLPYKTKYASIVAPAGCPVSEIPFETLRKETERFLGTLLKEATTGTGK
jgi:ADP-heptose:LPS heptosyltransferase